jgi:sulfotransferase family protein
MSPTIKRRLPEVIGVGPGRTGSTWLHRVLEGHVDLPHGIKETQFFSTFFYKGIGWYERHFRYATGERKIVDICPYFFKAEARDRIKEFIPDVRIITTMRDPVDRLYSMYKLLRHSGTARRGTFEDTLKCWPSMAGANRYASHLKAWFDTFGSENVLVTIYDELRAEPQCYVNRVTDFIGIERISLAEKSRLSDETNSFARAPKNRKLARRATALKYWLRGQQAYRVVSLLEHAGVWEFCGGRGEPFPKLTLEQDARLREHFLPEVEALEEMLNLDLSAWKKPREPRRVSVNRATVDRATLRGEYLKLAFMGVLGGLLALGMIQTAVSPTNPFDELTSQSAPFYRL